MKFWCRWIRLALIGLACCKRTLAIGLPKILLFAVNQSHYFYKHLETTPPSTSMVKLRMSKFESCFTEGTKFQRCPKGTEAKTTPLVGIFNLFLKALSGLMVNTIVFGRTDDMCVEELLLDKLESLSDRIMISRKSLWHLQLNLVQHKAKTFMMPSLEKAGKRPTETIVEHLKSNEFAIFVTNDPTQLNDELPGNSETKEKCIGNLLQACFKALKMILMPQLKVMHLKLSVMPKISGRKYRRDLG